MHRLSIILVGILSIGLAGSASALTLADSQLAFDGSSIAGTVDIDLVGDTTLELVVNVTQGKVGRARVQVQSESGVARTVDGFGTVNGAGVDVNRIRVRANGAVDFYFKKSFFHWHIHAGESSDQFSVSYSDLAANDVVTFTGYRHWIFGSFASAQTTIVPEPSTAVLVGLGVVGLAVAGRKRA
jgi:hypothetical protein